MGKGETKVKDMPNSKFQSQNCNTRQSLEKGTPCGIVQDSGALPMLLSIVYIQERGIHRFRPH